MASGSLKEDPGLFGPDSVIWRVNRESAVALAGTAAILMQFAHPKVAAGAGGPNPHPRRPPPRPAGPPPLPDGGGFGRPPGGPGGGGAREFPHHRGRPARGF